MAYKHLLIELYISADTYSKEPFNVYDNQRPFIQQLPCLSQRYDYEADK